MTVHVGQVHSAFKATSQDHSSFIHSWNMGCICHCPAGNQLQARQAMVLHKNLHQVFIGTGQRGVGVLEDGREEVPESVGLVVKQVSGQHCTSQQQAATHTLTQAYSCLPALNLVLARFFPSNAPVACSKRLSAAYKHQPVCVLKCRLPGSADVECTASKLATSAPAPESPGANFKVPLSHCDIHWVGCSPAPQVLCY